jgi:hypothetical protein
MFPGYEVARGLWPWNDATGAASRVLTLPAIAGFSRQVSPAAMWCPVQQRLRWQASGLVSGQSGAFRAAFHPPADADMEAVAAAAATTSVRLRFAGPEKRTLSGIGLESGIDGDSLEPAQVGVAGLRPCQLPRHC